MARTPRLLQEEDVFFDEDDDPNAPDLTLLKGSGKTSTWEWELVVDGEVHNFVTHYGRASAFPFLAVASFVVLVILYSEAISIMNNPDTTTDETPSETGGCGYNCVEQKGTVIGVSIMLWCFCAPLLMLAGYCCRKRDPPLIMYQVRQDFGVWPRECHATRRTLKTPMLRACLVDRVRTSCRRSKSGSCATARSRRRQSAALQLARAPS